MELSSKIKKYLHNDIYSLELQKVFITEKTVILKNDDNTLDYENNNNFIQYNLIINSYDSITYYEDEIMMAFNDYEILLKQKTLRDEIIRSSHEYDTMYE
jgi:hypothetical protein